MSGLGPAACWLAHKRIESWSRIAKERVSAVRRVTLDRNSEESTTPPPSASGVTPPSSASSTRGSAGSFGDSSDFPATAMSTLNGADNASASGSAPAAVSASSSSSSAKTEVNIMRESLPIQPQAAFGSGSGHNVTADILRGSAEALPNPVHLHHQSRSFPPRLQRTPSISSQSSVDSAPSRYSSHRGSSPQIRTFGPDGRSSLPSEPAYPAYMVRGQSPMRTISLDARCSSPATTDICGGDMHTPSPSQTSLVSLSGCSPGIAVGASCGAAVSPKMGGSRCLSPLLIPPRPQPNIDPVLAGPASPIGAIQPDLYRVQDGPVYLNAPETSSALGRVHLRVKYDYHLFDLTVHLIEAHNLCPIEEGGFRDPYVCLLLLPEVDNRKRQTQIFRGEANPYFDQHFKFPVSRDQLKGKELIVQVMDYDRYSHNDIIGEVHVCMDELDLSKSVEIWGDLIRVRKPQENRPELLCSLNYLPQAERLTIVIMKAKNLDVEQESYVKLYLIQNGKRVKKKKTSSSKSEDPSRPIWNEAFSFNVQSGQLANTAIEIYVVASGGDSVEIGSCGLGPQENGTGAQHWHDMINNARKPTAMWHYIR